MFSFLVRDEEGIWIPGAYCVVQKGKIAYALQAFKRWCSWQPRYVLTDNSAVEQLAIQRAFPGLQEGEQEVDHLLCTVHTMRTHNKGFKATEDKPTFNALRQAMYTFTTGFKCPELCVEAVMLAHGGGGRLHPYLLARHIKEMGNVCTKSQSTS